MMTEQELNAFVKELEKYHFVVGEDDDYFPRSTICTVLRSWKFEEVEE